MKRLIKPYIKVKNFICLSIFILNMLSNAAHSIEYDSNLVLSVMTESLAVDISVRDNPSLAQMQARHDAISAIPSQVGALPDPMVNFSAMNFPVDSFDRNQEAMTQVQIGFTQEFPFPGKLSLKEEAAEFDVLAARHTVEEVQLQIIKQVKSKWWQLYYLDRALETVSLNQALLRQLISVAETKYKTGKGLQQDVLLAQLELSKLMDREIQLQSIRRNQAIQLNILMNRPANDTLPLPDQVSIAMPDVLDEDILYQLAESARPHLKRVESQIEAAQVRLNLAKRNYYPDFKLGLSYGDRIGDNPLPRGGERADLLSVMVGIKIPLYAGRKQSKAISQKRSELQGNRYALIDEKSLVMAAISTAVTDYHQAKQQFLLFGSGIVPQAQQTVASMLAGYQVSEVDFLNLVRSQMTLFNYELQYWKALSNANQALARLEAAVGKESIYE